MINNIRVQLAGAVSNVRNEMFVAITEQGAYSVKEQELLQAAEQSIYAAQNALKQIQDSK